MNLPLCAPLFFAGPIAYALTKRAKPRFPAQSFLLFLGAVVLVWSIYGDVHMSWVLAIVVGFSLPFFKQLRWKPLLQVAEQIAKYSYGIYLFHFVSMAIAFYYLHTWPLVWRLAVFTLTLILFSTASYHLIEQPFIRLGKLLAEHSSAWTRATAELEPAP